MAKIQANAETIKVKDTVFSEKSQAEKNAHHLINFLRNLY